MTAELRGKTIASLLDILVVHPENALDRVELAAHMKKVFGATPSDVPPLPSATASPTWRSSLSDHPAGLPALWKQAVKMKSGKATTTWSIPAEIHKFHTARADQLTYDQPILQYMLWYCVLMCRTQDGNEVPNRLADGKVFIITKPGGSGPDKMRFISLLDSTGKLLFGYWLPTSWTRIDTGSLDSPLDEGGLIVRRSDMRLVDELVERQALSKIR